MRKNRIALHQLRQDHDGDNQAVQGDGLTQSDEDQALTEGLFVLAVGSDSSRRSGGNGHAAADTGQAGCQSSSHQADAQRAVVVVVGVDSLGRSRGSGGVGGGIIGGCLAYYMCQAFGLIGAFIIDIIVLIVCMVLITERSALRGMQKGGKKVYESAKESNEKYREYREYRAQER